MEKLIIYAAGSLRVAFPEIAKQFTEIHSTQIEFKFAPAGLLYEKIIEESAHPHAHLFASANTLHPQNLIKQNLASSHFIFADNSLCLVVRNQPHWTTLDMFKHIIQFQYSNWYVHTIKRSIWRLYFYII